MHNEHIFFLIHSSFNHDTRTCTQIGTTRSTPRIPCTSYQPLQDFPVDKQRHQAPLWRGNLQSGGNPRNTCSTGYEPKELATVSRISSITDPYQLHDVQEKLEKKIPELQSPKKWKNLEKLGTHGLPDYKISETSYCQSHMHFDDSVESIADSDLEDGELRKILSAGAEVMPPGQPARDHMANGRVEMAVREVTLQCRTLPVAAEQNTNVRIADDNPLLGWRLLFAGHVMNKNENW